MSSIYHLYVYIKMNTSETNEEIYGVQKGVIIGQFDRVDELNDRMSSRHFPTHELQPNFSPRSVPTKYSLFPVIERRKAISEPIRQMPRHSVSNNFNPATSNGPVTSYLANIDTETILRNQTAVLQHGAEQRVYVPSSQSDLYNTHSIGRIEEQTHPLLFERQQYATTQTNNGEKYGIGQNQLYNHTRTQLRNTNIPYKM